MRMSTKHRNSHKHLKHRRFHRNLTSALYFQSETRDASPDDDENGAKQLSKLETDSLPDQLQFIVPNEAETKDPEITARRVDSHLNASSRENSNLSSSSDTRRTSDPASSIHHLPLHLESALERLTLSRSRHSRRAQAKIDEEERKKREEEDRLITKQLLFEQNEFFKRQAEENARREAEKARQARLEEEDRARRGYRSAPASTVILPLSAEWEEKIDAAMRTAPNRELATTSTGTIIPRKSFGTLLPQHGHDPSHGWLNDEIIAASMQHVVDYALERSGHQRGHIPRYHAFNSFFYKNLKEKGPESIERWANRAKIGGKNLFSVEMVFLPVNYGAHWTLLVVSPTKKTIEYFDSFGGEADSFLENTKKWLRQELANDWKEEEWTARAGISPRQYNGKDCGVFTVTTAKMVMLGWDPEKAYNDSHMSLQRRRIAAELMNGGFHGEFIPVEPEGRWQREVSKMASG